MNSWMKLIRGLYLKRKIDKAEKRLCKYVSKLMGVKIISVGRYIKDGGGQGE